MTYFFFGGRPSRHVLLIGNNSYIFLQSAETYLTSFSIHFLKNNHDLALISHRKRAFNGMPWMQLTADSWQAVLKPSVMTAALRGTIWSLYCRVSFMSVVWGQWSLSSTHYMMASPCWGHSHMPVSDVTTSIVDIWTHKLLGTYSARTKLATMMDMSRLQTT